MDKYKHTTQLFKKQNFLKIKVTIGTPAGVLFRRKKPSAYTVQWWADEGGANEMDQDITQPEPEIDWDNTPRNITTEVYDLSGTRRYTSEHVVHTNGATKY